MHIYLSIYLSIYIWLGWVGLEALNLLCILLHSLYFIFIFPSGRLQTTMTKLFFFVVFFTLSVLSVQCQGRFGDNTFNVLDFGAAGDGSTDDTQAFEEAWKATCSSREAYPIMRVPSGYTFLLLPLVFAGPCISHDLNVVIDGNLTAPSDPAKWKCNRNRCRQWIAFTRLDGLYIYGHGSINGQGTNWWGISYCQHNTKACGRKPTGFTISHSNNVHISNLSFKDSPQIHISLERSTWVYFDHLHITAPGDSPNTDGIHTQHSSNVFITQSHIGTGDDCISIGDGSSNLNISIITCGPGHGISIGSLGIRGKYETVENVYVSDVEFRGTQNGARIKTWQGGNGFARNIVFERIRSVGSAQPIIIDQNYCDHTRCTKEKSAVQVSNVRYSHIYGTSSEETAVTFACSESVPCRDILMNDIELQSTRYNIQTTSVCQNVEGRQNGEVFPSVPCLTI